MSKIAGFWKSFKIQVAGFWKKFQISIEHKVLQKYYIKKSNIWPRTHCKTHIIIIYLFDNKFLYKKYSQNKTCRQIIPKQQLTTKLLHKNRNINIPKQI